MASETCERPCRGVQGRVFGSTPSKSQFSFYENPEELAGTLSLPWVPLNIATVAIVGLQVPPKDYTNEEVQDIIQKILEAWLRAIKGPCDSFLKARFSDVYRGNNHMAYYNFCQ